MTRSEYLIFILVGGALEAIGGIIFFASAFLGLWVGTP